LNTSGKLPQKRRFRDYLVIIGPGIAIAATGVGAGDMVSAAVSGSRYGITIAWAAVVGALLKFVLNEGIARWQLATGTTILEGWINKLGRWVQLYFLIYIVIWSFLVGAALMSACGLVAHAIFPGISVAGWGIIHSVIAAIIILFTKYQRFETIMKFLIAIMFITIIGCAIWIQPPTTTLIESISQAGIPGGSSKFIMGVIGGVGGTLALLAYGYWIREKGWSGPEWKSVVRFDLGISYVFTGLFGVAIIVLASTILYTKGADIAGNSGVIKMAEMLGDVLGRFGQWAFLIGFWGTVASSMLGVWQGTPYIFCDFVGLAKKLPSSKHQAIINSRSKWYRGFLIWLAGPPLLLLALDRPIALIILFTVVAALFMPFLSGTLLYMNSRKEWVGENFRNGWLTNLLLLSCLALFGYLCVDELMHIIKQF